MKKIFVVLGAIVGVIAVAVLAGWLFWPFSVREAVRSGNIHAVRRFVEKGGDVNVKDKQRDFSIGDTTLLMHAAKNGRFEIAQYLIEHGADVNAVNRQNDTALVRAAFFGHTDIMQLLIDHGADVKSQGDQALLKASGSVFAKEDSLIEAIKLLLQNGVDINYANKFGDTALSGAILRKYNKMAKFLLEHGARADDRLLAAMSR